MFLASDDEGMLINTVAMALSDQTEENIMQVFRNPTSSPVLLRQVLQDCGKCGMRNFDFLNSVSIVMCNYVLAFRYTKDFPAFYS